MEPTIAIPADTRERLNRVTSELGVTETEICRRALSAYLDRHDRLDILRRVNEVYSDSEASAKYEGAARMQVYTLERNS
jgi:predicted DNA-binding protein